MQFDAGYRLHFEGLKTEHGKWCLRRLEQCPRRSCRWCERLETSLFGGWLRSLGSFGLQLHRIDALRTGDLPDLEFLKTEYGKCHLRRLEQYQRRSFRSCECLDTSLSCCVTTMVTPLETKFSMAVAHDELSLQRGSADVSRYSLGLGHQKGLWSPVFVLRERLRTSSDQCLTSWEASLKVKLYWLVEPMVPNHVAVLDSKKYVSLRKYEFLNSGCRYYATRW
jgi:hypothetical protein